MKVDTSSSAATGGVFITDVNPTSSGTVTSKVYQDTSVLTSCSADTGNVTVSVLAFTGISHLMPRVTVNGTAISNFVLNAQMRWQGSAAITGSVTNIIATHEDGGTWTTTVTQAAGPSITAFHLTGGYPSGQTEVKVGDTFQITFATSIPSTQVEIQNTEAAQYSLQSISGSGPYTVSITVATRGAGTFANQRVQIRCLGNNGIWSSLIYSDVSGSGDGSAYIQLNSDVPVISTITQSNITYPGSQKALKNSETATVANTITVPTGTFSVAYSSGNGDLTPSNASTYETNKVVTRAGGSYNISTNNLTITATKVSNKAVTTYSSIVYIANAAHTVSITQPYARLRSGQTPQVYAITLTATQQLLSAPSLNALTSGQGTWSGSFTGSGTTWNRNMSVADTDSKGTFSYSGLSSTNLAGIVVSTITSGGSYVLGGFTLRTLTCAAWPVREISIGTQVSNTAKLQCTNLSKGSSGSLNDTFQASTTSNVGYYTITQPTGVYNATGNLWYNADTPNAASNTTGTLQIELEEIV